MIRSSLCLVAAVACLATAPLGAVAAAQQPQQPVKAPTPAGAAPAASGPRLAPEFKSFKPKLAEEEAAITASAAAADRTVITISTLGLVIIGILLILLLT